MSTAYKNSGGFGVIEVILVAVILGILGFAGWYVYDSKNKSDKSLTTASETQSEAIKINQDNIQEDDEAAMFEAAKKFCLANGGSPCDASLDKRKGDVASVKTESMLVLVSKDTSGNWLAILGNSSDSDICDTGTDAPQLKELCS